THSETSRQNTPDVRQQNGRTPRQYAQNLQLQLTAPMPQPDDRNHPQPRRLKALDDHQSDERVHRVKRLLLALTHALKARQRPESQRCELPLLTLPHGDCRDDTSLSCPSLYRTLVIDKIICLL